MTDFQYKSMIKMAATIVRESKDKETALENLEKLLRVNETEKTKTDKVKI
jgi:hypothetical protein